MEIAGFQALEERFEHAGVALSVYRVADVEALVDRDRLLREDSVPEPPYWAHLWIGARALARELAEAEPYDGRRVLDLGCGLGLPGLVAAAMGADVWFVDREPSALEFVRASARRNGLVAARFVEADFTRDRLEVDFDAILGAELVYAPETYLPLADFLERHLRSGGTLHLTDAFRADAATFFAELERRGFTGRRRARREWEGGRPHGLFLWTFRRAG